MLHRKRNDSKRVQEKEQDWREVLWMGTGDNRQGEVDEECDEG
jgi:hypothetical protein